MHAIKSLERLAGTACGGKDFNSVIFMSASLDTKMVDVVSEGGSQREADESGG